MRSIIRNNIYMIITAWCLVLNGHSILCLFALVLGIAYLLYELENKNFWRVTSISIITFLLSFVVAKATIMPYAENCLYFLIGNSINVGLLFEAINKASKKTLLIDSLIAVCVFTFFISYATLLPSKYAMGGSKANTFGLILLIFVPYSSMLLVKALEKITKEVPSLNIRKVHSIIMLKRYQNDTTSNIN